MFLFKDTIIFDFDFIFSVILRLQEYAAVLHEREKQRISDKHKEYEVVRTTLPCLAFIVRSALGILEKSF